jgi:hypothetical protein
VILAARVNLAALEKVFTYFEWLSMIIWTPIFSHFSSKCVAIVLLLPSHTEKYMKCLIFSTLMLS